MNYSFCDNVIIILGIFSLLLSNVSGKHPVCGDSSPWNCMNQCHTQCMGQVKETTTEDFEPIAKEMNLCASKCYGEVYRPTYDSGVSYTKGRIYMAPKLTDFSDCLGPCKHPVNEYCIKPDYLSQFLYCDCHHCCQAKETKYIKPDDGYSFEDDDNRRLCAVGCHEWFYKLWSPMPEQGCHASALVRNSPESWCLQLCTWRLWKYSNGTANLTSSGELPKSYDVELSVCKRRCKVLQQSGVTVDYNNARSHMCIDIGAWECITNITIVSFNFKKSQIDSEIQKVKKVGGFKITEMRAPNIKNSDTAKQLKFYCNTSNTTFQQTVVLHRTSGMEKLYSIPNIKISESSEVNTEVDYSPTSQYSQYFLITQSATKFLRSMYSTLTQNDGTITKTIDVKEQGIYELDLSPCQEMRNQKIEFTTADSMTIDYEVIFRVLASSGRESIDYNEFKKINQSSGLQDINYHDFYDDQLMSSSGSLTGNFPITFMRKELFACEPLEKCTPSLDQGCGYLTWH